jgi:hypothetical protein
VTSISLSSGGYAATATVASSPYTITPSAAAGSGLGNYTINYVNGSFTVNPAGLTITAKNESKTYGVAYTPVTTNPGEFTVSGLLNSDTVTSISLSSGGYAATATVASSPYTITPSAAAGSGLGNYTINYVNGSFTVNPAGLTITASSVLSKTYGATYAFDTTPPSSDFSVSGLKNSDTVASISFTSAGAPASAAISTPGSPYAVVPSAAQGTGLGNYTINYVNGSLAVTPALLTITAKNINKTYGATYSLNTTNPGGDFTVTGLVNGDTVTSVSMSSGGTAASATVTSPGPNYTITIGSAVGTGLPNYNIVYNPGTLTVTQVPLTITANNVTKQYGDAYNFDTTSPSTDFAVTGTLYNGDSVSSVSLSSPGAAAAATIEAISPWTGSPYTITVSSAVGSGLGNYNISYVNGKLTIIARQAPVTYIGQTLFYTSGSSSTTAQVALGASVQDTTGSGADLKNATVTFTDLLSGKVLASNVPVTPVSGSTIPTGTANTIVTLSSGQYGAQEYLIQVTLGKDFANCQQTGSYTLPGSSTSYCSNPPWPAPDPSSTQYQAAHPTVTVAIPPTKNTIQALIPSLPTGSPNAAAGKYGSATPVSATVGMQYNNKGTSPQGQIQLTLVQGGTTYYIKSNSITSLGFSGTCNKNVTIYTKASIYSVNASGQQTSIDGNVTLRVDAHDGDASTVNPCTQSGSISPTYDTIGFTVLSSKDGSLYYSNNWVYNSSVGGWSTVQEPVSGPNGSAVAIN